jgi:tetratricopeptide (TPR) repeat protein
MGDRSDARIPEKRVRLHDDFVNGLRCFNSKDFEGALMFFRTADDSAELDDVYQSRYTSFHGLSRVFMGDRNGVKLCRKAAVGEIGDIEVYYNLAMAEHRLGFHESALMALRRGLNIDPEHAGLQRLQRELSRGEQRIPGFNVDSIVSRLLGKLLGRSG